MSTLRPTLKDVAAHSGYALRTVKKVMAEDPTVLPKTKEAVLQAAQALGYVPNRAASAIGRQKVIKIAVVYAKPSDIYFSDLEQGFQQRARELFDYGLHLEYRVSAQADWKDQENILLSLLDEPDLNGVICQPLSIDKLNPSINKLVQAGIPVVTVGSDAPDSQRLSFVGCHAYRSGRIAGQLMEFLTGGTGTVWIMETHADQEQARERTRGLVERLRERRTAISIYTPSDEELARPPAEVLRSLLAEHKINGVFCTSGTTTIEAGMILKEAQATQTAMIGFDLTQPSRALLCEGYIDCILDQKPALHAHRAVSTLFDYLSSDQGCDSIQTMPIYIHTSESLEDQSP